MLKTYVESKHNTVLANKFYGRENFQIEYFTLFLTGIIKTNTVVNATGVWGKDLLSPHGIHLPLVPMKHAYVISETIKEVQGMPNVRDHDYSLYFRIQGW